MAILSFNFRDKIIVRAMLLLDRYSKKFKIRYLSIVLALIFLIVACTNASKSDRVLVADSSTKNNVLSIWWEKGFNIQEDEALQTLLANWEKKTGNKIDLFFSGTDELLPKAQRAIQAGDLPDLILSFKAERSVSGRLAWDGKLADVSDIIEPVKKLYPETILKTVYLYNNVEKKRSYYGVPVNQSTTHVYYWKDLLTQVGRSEKDIPRDWNGFWQFWTKIQDELRTKKKMHIYGLGLPVSVESGDTVPTFEEILEAFDVMILDSKGQLQVDRPQVRQGIIKILDWYEQFYRQGYIPPEALHWSSPDNNRDLLNRKIVMTTNHTLSIPVSLRQDPDTFKKLGIVELPNKPNGKPMRDLVTVQQALVIAKSKQQQLAKDFISYLLQPKVMGEYLKTAGGRYAPVLIPVWKDSFWTDPKEPHISLATKTITKNSTRTYYTFQNPAYSEVLHENVWGKALQRVLVDKISSEQAADEAIARIKQIFAEW
jgi:multiple sugar transport system substrate-binding protein